MNGLIRWVLPSSISGEACFAQCLSARFCPRLFDLNGRNGAPVQQKNVSLKWQLILAPKNVCDYVVLHELMRTKILNPQPKVLGPAPRLAGNTAPSNLLNATGISPYLANPTTNR